jgi:hypothetical protein
MDQASVAAVLYHLGNDAIVHPYGDGVLVDLPMRYSDCDRVRLLVEPLGGEYRVTDRGEAADRLLVAGVTLNDKQRDDVLVDVIRAARLDEVSLEKGKLSVFGPQTNSGCWRTLPAHPCGSMS